MDDARLFGRSNDLYKSLFQDSHSVMLIIDPDTGEIADANSAACAFYGYTRSQVTTMRILDINTLSPEQVRAEMQDAKLEKRDHFNFRHRLASGEIRDVEVYSSPIKLAGKQFLYSIIHDVTERVRIENERETLIQELKDAHSEIKLLRGILPICAYCKNIRNGDGIWEKIELYIDRRSEASFSHGICPDCMNQHFPQVYGKQR